jgi:hypothetical protein
MVNLKAAALACGVVATCLGGGLGVSYINSTNVSSADFVEEAEYGYEVTEDEGSDKGVNYDADSEYAAANEKVTTSNETDQDEVI